LPGRRQTFDFVNQYDDKGLGIVHEVVDAQKEALYELARFREPFGKERVRVDLD
jgi:hypothetical protein